MAKIAICVRNRLGVTKKCIEALIKHSKYQHQIYIFDNLTDYRLKDHFDYFYELFSRGLIQQYVVNSKTSTYSAFSKAVALNGFGVMHEMDPQKNNIDFLVFLDNDIIVTKDWDYKIREAWKHVNRMKLDNIKVISQLPGGIKYTEDFPDKVAGYDAKIGKFGGSGFWTVKPNFFQDVGFLSVEKLVNKHKQHDQQYWRLMDRKNNGKKYILGLKTKLAIHVGKFAGSVCNKLSRNDMNISFEEADKKIESMDFDTFYNIIRNDKEMINDW